MSTPAPSTPPIAEAPAPSAAPVPTIRRRLAALVYEGVLLFGVVFIAGYLFGTLTQQRNGLTHHNLLTAWVALVVGAYFIWCWTRGGQTLPMKTWRLRLVAVQTGRPPTALRALARYVAAWLWFLPPLALHPLAHLSVPATLGVTAVWIVLWAAAARLDPTRQFPHDRLAGTRIVAAEPS